MVEELVDEARAVSLPVTRDTIKSFGLKARAAILESDEMAEDVRPRIEAFVAGDSWHRSYVSRHNMKTGPPHGEDGSVDAEAAAEGMRGRAAHLSRTRASGCYLHRRLGW